MRFADPGVLWLLLPLVLLLWAGSRRRPARAIALPSFSFLDRVPRTARARAAEWRPLLRGLALALVLVALARPQLPGEPREVRSRARNIMVALDISSSMKARDFQPGNRLVAARQVLVDFVRARENDLVGLVVFAGRAFLQAPLNPDRETLIETIGTVDIGLLPDGTAIGTALAMSLNQLKELPERASTVVLITDGANNTGRPSPFVAAEAARALGVRVHAIGLSSADSVANDSGYIWRMTDRASRLTRRDEEALRQIAERTGGAYYRATDPAVLSEILARIDETERADVSLHETRQYHEAFAWPLIAGVLLLGLDLILGATWLRRAP